jgi:uncharacterized protein YnzC (UPF0291/DUF896 family)
MNRGTEQYIKRINELANKAKAEGLTDEELEERNELRKLYIEAFRSSLRGQLEHIKFVDENGAIAEDDQKK